MLCDLFFNSSLICNVPSFVEITEIDRPTNMRFICSSKHASRDLTLLKKADVLLSNNYFNYSINHSQVFEMRK